MILANLGYVTQEAKALALQRNTSMTKGSQRPISRHNIQSHNVAYHVFEDSYLDQGLPRPVGMHAWPPFIRLVGLAYHPLQSAD
jgi:hypothetical protein